MSSSVGLDERRIPPTAAERRPQLSNVRLRGTRMSARGSIAPSRLTAATGCLPSIVLKNSFG